MYEVNIFRTINEIKKSCWDSLTCNNVFMCFDWLLSIEKIVTPAVDPYYIIVLSGEKLAGASVCYSEKKKDISSLDTLLFGRLKRVRFPRNISFLPAIVCGPKKGASTHLLVSKEINQDEYRMVLNKLIDEIEKIADEEKASVYFPGVMENEYYLIDSLTQRGYFKTFSLPVSYLDIQWSSFQDYKKFVSQKHPSMKKSIPRHINKNRKSGVIINEVQDVDGNAERFFELLQMNHNKYGNRMNLTPDSFKHIKEIFKDNAVIYSAVKDGKIIGVNLELKKDKEAVLGFVGIDYNYSQNDLTYFNIMFYEPIRNAIDRGMKRLYFGNALYSTKAKRGCTVSEIYMFYKPFNKRKEMIVKIWFSIHRLWMKRKFSFINKL